MSSTRTKGAKTTKNGRIFVTCTLSPEGFKKMHELMNCIGATSQGQVIEQGLHRWYATEPLIQDSIKEEVSLSPSPSPLSNAIKNRKGKKECNNKKTDYGKESENG